MKVDKRGRVLPGAVVVVVSLGLALGGCLPFGSPIVALPSPAPEGLATLTPYGFGPDAARGGQTRQQWLADRARRIGNLFCLRRNNEND